MLAQETLQQGPQFRVVVDDHDALGFRIHGL